MKKGLIITLSFVVILTGCFLLFKKNNSSHFNKNVVVSDSSFNLNLDVSGKEIINVQKEIKDKFNNLKVQIMQKGEIVDEFNLSEIADMNIDEQVIEAKTINDNFWGFDKYISQIIPIHLTVSVNFEKVQKIVQDLNCITNYIESEDAYLERREDGMYIVPEVYGTKLDVQVLVEKMQEYLQNSLNEVIQNVVIDIDTFDIYEKPTILSDNKDLVRKMEAFNKIANINIEYVFGTQIEKVSKETLCSWIDMNDEEEIVFKEDIILSYIENLAKTYNTFGTVRKFTTTSGKTIKVPAGDYGWSISQTAEVERLIEELKTGEDIHREPTWLYTGYGEYVYGDETDIGNTYVEISIPDQTLWLYVDGELKLTSEFVSGTENKERYTPSGVFGITYKTKNAVLRGPGYASPVSYWMPFNGGIGMHDATWRNSFGGNIYKTNGSHGCINLPLQKAKEIYNYMDTFFPIIVYRQEELNNAE